VGKIEDTDYVQFCGGAKPDWVTLGLKSGYPEWRITANVGHPSSFFFLPYLPTNSVIKNRIVDVFFFLFPRDACTGAQGHHQVETD
jgi:hypothetical protein